MNIENKNNELEKSLSEFEAKNNTLNKKNENLNNENNILKKENENLSKEKSELSNLLKEEKKLGDKMKNQNDLLNKENTKIDILSNENKKLKEDILKKDDFITKAQNKLILEEKNLKNKEEKIQNLIKEIEALKTQYNELLNKYNDHLLNLQNKEKNKEEALKNIDEKYKYLLNLPPEELIKLILEKDKINLESQKENSDLLNKNNSLTERNKKLTDYLDKAKNLKQRYEKLRNAFTDLTKTAESITKERDEYKNKYDKLLESLIIKDKESKRFKSTLLAIINTSQLTLKKQIIKKPQIKINQNIKIYDYLCIRLEQNIIPSLEDEHYDGITVFTESIKYIDQQNDTSDDCILFITREYFYLFNWNYKKCFAIPIISLSMINVTKSSNYVSFIFQRGEVIIIEIFRVLELINFFKLLKAKQKSYQFEINPEPFIYNDLKNSKNCVEGLYFGKAYFSGHFWKKSEGIFIDKNEERFGVLCEIGLIILESPTGKPKDIINLLFAEINSFNNEKGKNCLAISVGSKLYQLSFETEKIRTEWEQQINLWKKNNSLLTKFN